MTVRELVEKIAAIDRVMILKNEKPVCDFMTYGMNCIKDEVLDQNVLEFDYNVEIGAYEIYIEV